MSKTLGVTYQFDRNSFVDSKYALFRHLLDWDTKTNLDERKRLKDLLCNAYTKEDIEEALSVLHFFEIFTEI
jgi:hypothetical protein